MPASCDLPDRLERQRERLRSQGVVEVAGAQPYRWTFRCSDPVLQINVETIGPAPDGDPLLWLGAASDPPRLVPVRLDVGRGQEELERLLSDPARPDPLVMKLDMTTGVIWAE